MTLAPLALAGQSALAVPGSLELGDHHCPVELTYCAEYLTDQLGGWRVIEERLRTVRCDQFDAETLEFGEPDLLHHEIACEATGRFDDNGPHAVVGDPSQQRREAGSCFDGVRAAHGRVVEPIDHLQAGTLRVPVHGEFVITLRLASGTDRGNGTAKRNDQGRHGRAAVLLFFY